MKSFRILAVIAILMVLALAESTYLVNADTSANQITKDFGQTNYYSSTNNSIFASINVKASIETEPNGHWIVNNSYQVSLLITITYVNESVYNPNGFAIECYRSDYPISFDDANLMPSTNDVTVTPQNNGTMIMTVKPLVAKDTGLYFDFSLKVYYNNNIVTSGSWTQGLKNTPPIPITVDSNQHLPFDTPTTPELTPIALVVGLIAVSTMALIVSKRQKKL
jgi:hypothetical protein